jgi:hypothetical protein
MSAGQVFLQQGVDPKLFLTAVAAEHGGYSVGFQFCTFDNSAAAQAIEIPLDPLILQIAQGANLKVHRYDFFYVVGSCVLENNLKYILRYGKLVHRFLSFIFCY